MRIAANSWLSEPMRLIFNLAGCANVGYKVEVLLGQIKQCECLRMNWNNHSVRRGD